MSSTYKQFTNNDKVSTRTLLHEAIPLTGTIVSGTYVDSSTPPIATNCKGYAHGMFQSVYDYPYLSSSANHIFDISVGISPNSALSSSTPIEQQSKKINIYNQMAQVLMGYDATGSIQSFDEDGNLTGGTKIEECFFLNFSRLLTKDEAQKGTFQLDVDVHQACTLAAQPFTEWIRIRDISGSSGYHVNSPAGEYGILYAYTGDGATTFRVVGENTNQTSSAAPCGLIFYQAGVAIISGSIFNESSNTITPTDGILTTTQGGSQLSSSHHFAGATPTTTGTDDLFISGTIDHAANALRHRIKNIQFNNTIELNSTVYFCRANHNEFNYSSNPTYLSGSQIRVKTQASDTPISYITSVGLYSADGFLLGVAKLSEPIKKTSSEEYIFRCRVDY